jgi:HSF-type DNA-binding
MNNEGNRVDEYPNEIITAIISRDKIIRHMTENLFGLPHPNITFTSDMVIQLELLKLKQHQNFHETLLRSFAKVCNINTNIPSPHLFLLEDRLRLETQLRSMKHHIPPKPLFAYQHAQLSQGISNFQALAALEVAKQQVHFTSNLNHSRIRQGVSKTKDCNVRIRNPVLSFPGKLHAIISNPEYNDYITWLPHGCAWKIMERSQFEDIVIPRHFRHGRYSSFMRQVSDSMCESTYR